MSIQLKINGCPQEVRFSSFSGGERQVKIDKSFIPAQPKDIFITAFIKKSEDILDLLLLDDAIERLGCKISTKKLHMPYIPYARQDRVMNRGEALSISRFAQILQVMNFDKIIVDDPHSDVSPALIKNIHVIEQHLLVHKHLAEKIRKEKTLLVSPDAGAIKKTQKLADTMALEPIVIGHKKRDTKTGGISGTGFIGDVSGRNVLITDDICDGGWTFIKLGEALKAAGAKKVILWVTHGIFSKGVDVFSGTIDEIYCKNIWEENVEGRNTLGILKEMP